MPVRQYKNGCEYVSSHTASRSSDDRRGSRRNGDRFPKQRAPKTQGSGEGIEGYASPENFFFWVIYKNLTDFRKTVETGMDPRLDDRRGITLNAWAIEPCAQYNDVLY